MTNPLLKAAGITPDTPGHSAERALFDAAWECVEQLRDRYDEHEARICCGALSYRPHGTDCPLVAFDEAAKVFSGGSMTTVKAEIEVDHQHGPIVRVTINNVSVAVYLMSETAVANTPTGPYGLEVIGPWPTFRGACLGVFS